MKNKRCEFIRSGCYQQRSLTVALSLVTAICLFLEACQGQDRVRQLPFRSYAPYPEPDSGYVTDLANLLSDSEEEEIERQLWKAESTSGIEILVVTINSIRDYPGTSNGSIEDFAMGLFNTYGIGNRQTNDGVLLLVAVKDRSARIELGKSYAHRYDRTAKAIIDQDLVPHFRRQEYAEGINVSIRSCLLKFPQNPLGRLVRWSVYLLALALCGLVALSLIHNGKRGWGWICVGGVFILVLLILQVVSRAGREAIESADSDSWSPGGFGGGFGGGSSGGGGATGSW